MSKEIKFRDPNCYHEAVLFYRETFNLMMNAGWRRDVVATVKTHEDLLLWQDTVSHWGYVDKQTGLWKKRNPLDVRGMINVFEYRQREAQRKKDEIQRQANLQERSRARLQLRGDSPLPALRHSTNGWKG